MKKQTITILAIFAALITAPFVAADSYELWCLYNGDSVDFGQLCAPGRPVITAPDPGFVSVCVRLMDTGSICHAPLGICNGRGLNCSGGSTGNTTIDTTPPELDIFSPINGALLTSKNVLIDLTSNERVDIQYQKVGSGRWTNICSDCTQYSRERSFDEGFNEILFKATDRANNEAFYTIVFNIDSKEPRIRSLEPDRGFASGTFSVSFDEDNPGQLALNYGNFDIGFREHFFDIGTECIQSGDTECTTSVDLADYDGQQIQAYATITDLAGNIDETNQVELDVDNSDPVINSVDYAVEGKKVTFTVDLTEPYLDEVVYIDNSDSNPREKNLCSRLDNGICEKRATFNDEGTHDVTIIVRDEAGNEATQNVQFFTDSKEPKIRDTLPDRGFASGTFEIEFEENNPTSLVLEYGNIQTGFRTREFTLANCVIDEEEYFCSEYVELADYDGQEISYTFSVTDQADQVETKTEDGLAVDISFPIIQNIDYVVDGRNVYFTIEIDEAYVDEITYIDNLDPRPRESRLCNRLENGICEKKASFREDGDHDVTITVIDEAGHSSAQNVQFFTDSKEPRIRNMMPDRGFASGLFEVEFDELNPTSVLLEYGNSDIGFRTSELSIQNDCTIGDDEDEYFCSKDVNLADYDGQEIMYDYTITDRAGQTEVDSEDRLMVDISYPEIQSITYVIDRDRAEVVLTVIEQNLDQISYINLDDNRPRERRFCSRLSDEGTCDKRIGLEPGTNRIDFTVIDEAGNAVAQQLVIQN